MKKYKFLIKGNEEALHFFRSMILTETTLDNALKYGAEMLNKVVSGKPLRIPYGSELSQEIMIYLRLFKQIKESFGEEWGRFICCQIYKLKSNQNLNLEILNRSKGQEDPRIMMIDSDIYSDILNFINSNCRTGDTDESLSDNVVIRHNQKNALFTARQFFSSGFSKYYRRIF